MEELKLEHKGYTCIAKRREGGGWRIGNGYDENSDSPLNFSHSVDTEQEAQKLFEEEIDGYLKRKEYNESQEEWKKSIDYKSVAAVFNILPDVFRQRITEGKFDKALLNAVIGSDYVVPLYYVTKAYDVLLKGSLGTLAFMIGPEEDDDCTEDDIQEYLRDECATRTRGEAIKQNDEVKQVWKEMLGVDIDSLNVDFTQFDMHLPPKVSRDDFYWYFEDVPDGVNEWVIGAINHPKEDSIYFDEVSALMEYTAEILKYERPIGDNKLEL